MVFTKPEYNEKEICLQMLYIVIINELVGYHTIVSGLIFLFYT